MQAWEPIQITLEYLEAHLDEKPDTDALAAMASLSPFYYQKLFSKLVKKPVGEYVKLRRLAKATETLTDTDKRILDIALELGFQSHEHFTRAFKAAFGMTPNEYRTNPIALNRMNKPELLLQYTLVDEGVPLVTEGIVLEMRRAKLDTPVRFTGVRIKERVETLNGLGTESGVDPLDLAWRDFHARKATEMGIPEENDEVGSTLPCEEEGFFYYFAGARDESPAREDAFAHWELPAGDYVVCEFEAENFNALVMDALYKALQYAYTLWLPKHNLQTGPFCAERYQSHSPDTTSMELWWKLV